MKKKMLLLVISIVLVLTTVFSSFQFASASLGYPYQGSQSDLITNRILGGRFQCTTSGLATTINAYIGGLGKPTLGDTAKETTHYGTINVKNNVGGAMFACTISDVVESISAYVKPSITSGFHIKGAIYDSSGNFLIGSNELTSVQNTNAQTITLPLTSPLSVTASSSYILVIWSDNDLTLYTSSVQNGKVRSVSNPYDPNTWPVHLTFASSTYYQPEIYLTYTYQPTHFKAAIYSSPQNNPSTLLQISNELTVTAPGLITFALDSPVPVTSGAYYTLLVKVDKQANIYCNSGGQGAYVWGAYDSSWPSSQTFTAPPVTYSIYSQIASSTGLALSKSGTQPLGTTVTCTASVNSGATGNVQFQVKTPESSTWSTFSTVALSSGAATSDYLLSATGAYSFQTVYVGDATYATSTSSVLPLNAKADPTLTLICNPNPVDKTNQHTTTISGTLTGVAGGLVGETIQLSINQGLGEVISIPLSTVSGGVYTYVLNVDDYLNGGYIVQATFNGNENYNSATATMDGNGSLFVVPEYLFGAFASLLACLGAFVIFKKRGSISHFKSHT